MDEMRVQMIAEVSSFKNNDYLKDLRQAIQELNLSNQNIEILYDNLIKNEEFDKLIDVVVNGDYKNLEVFVLFYDKINFNCVCSFNIVKMFSKICEYISDRCGKDDRCSERKDDRYSGNDKYNMTYVNDERKDDRYSGNVSNITNSKSIIQDENKSNTTISKSNITKFIKMQNILIDLLHFIELDNLNEEELKYFNNVLDKLKNSEWYNCEESVNIKILVSYISIRVLKRIGLNK
ncbi:hypothetical protein NAPIS_ORF01449 [Vairimorpha apis BRL 01]|uniref:Uncharacterized protein n=1 Tax=Vairimorpha apis BRL 01 TaxID=1037528 RepID=T0MCT2_9MICR|nr:hypothetical protein NAPIS_ORF01449 [Vairimorpha apis BRL 01]